MHIYLPLIDFYDATLSSRSRVKYEILGQILDILHVVDNIVNIVNCLSHCRLPQHTLFAFPCRPTASLLLYICHVGRVVVFCKPPRTRTHGLQYISYSDYWCVICSSIYAHGRYSHFSSLNVSYMIMYFVNCALESCPYHIIRKLSSWMDKWLLTFDF